MYMVHEKGKMDYGSSRMSWGGILCIMLMQHGDTKVFFWTFNRTSRTQVMYIPAVTVKDKSHVTSGRF
jgi:hypothetical protein